MTLRIGKNGRLTPFLEEDEWKQTNLDNAVNSYLRTTQTKVIKTIDTKPIDRVEKPIDRCEKISDELRDAEPGQNYGIIFRNK